MTQQLHNSWNGLHIKNNELECPLYGYICSPAREPSTDRSRPTDGAVPQSCKGLFLSQSNNLRNPKSTIYTYLYHSGFFFCINFFLFFFVCVGLLTCVWFYFYRFCLAILAQTIIEHKLNPFMYICWFASSHHNIKTQTKDHKFCPWAETQSQTPPSSVRTLPRRSKCVCVYDTALTFTHTYQHAEGPFFLATTTSRWKTARCIFGGLWGCTRCMFVCARVSG